MEKRVLIVDTAPKDMAVYLQYYAEACDRLGIAYDYMFWDRGTDGGLEYDGRVYTYHSKAPGMGGRRRYSKFWPLLKYRQTVKDVIKKVGYTHLVFANTMLPVSLRGFLCKHYANRFILDIRDYTYEYLWFYRDRVDDLISHSGMSVISSEGFYEFIKPHPNIVLTHNMGNENEVESFPTLKAGKVNTLGFVGSVRYEEENESIIRQLYNLPDYKLLYAGRIQDGIVLPQYCEDNGYGDVDFLGAFNNAEKSKIYKRIDIINAVYGTRSREVTTAIPNRYYDALLYKKPLIASEGTFLGRMAEKNGIGLAVDLKKNDLAARLEEYIRKFSPEDFNNCCELALAQVNKDLANYKARMEDFFES